MALGPSVSVISVMSLKLIASFKGSDMSRSAHGVLSRACKWIPSPRSPRRGRTGATGQTGQRLTCDIQHAPPIEHRYSDDRTRWAGVAAAGAARPPTTHSHPADSGYGTLMDRGGEGCDRGRACDRCSVRRSVGALPAPVRGIDQIGTARGSRMRLGCATDCLDSTL